MSHAAELHQTNAEYSGKYGGFLVRAAGNPGFGPKSFGSRDDNVQVAGGPLMLAPVVAGTSSGKGFLAWLASLGIVSMLAPRIDDETVMVAERIIVPKLALLLLSPFAIATSMSANDVDPSNALPNGDHALTASGLTTAQEGLDVAPPIPPLPPSMASPSENPRAGLEHPEHESADSTTTPTRTVATDEEFAAAPDDLDSRILQAESHNEDEDEVTPHSLVEPPPDFSRYEGIIDVIGPQLVLMQQGIKAATRSAEGVDIGPAIDHDHPAYRASLLAGGLAHEIAHPNLPPSHPYFFAPNLDQTGATAMVPADSANWRTPPVGVFLSERDVGLAANGHLGNVTHEDVHYRTLASFANHTPGLAASEVESAYHIEFQDENGNTVKADEVRARVEKIENHRQRFTEVSARPAAELASEYRAGDLGDWLVPFLAIEVDLGMPYTRQLGRTQIAIIDSFLEPDANPRMSQPSPNQVDFQVGQGGPLETLTVHPALLPPKPEERLAWFRDYLGRTRGQIEQDLERANATTWAEFEEERLEFARQIVDAIRAN